VPLARPTCCLGSRATAQHGTGGRRHLLYPGQGNLSGVSFGGRVGNSTRPMQDIVSGVADEEPRPPAKGGCRWQCQRRTHSACRQQRHRIASATPRSAPSTTQPAAQLAARRSKSGGGRFRTMPTFARRATRRVLRAAARRVPDSGAHAPSLATRLHGLSPGHRPSPPAPAALRGFAASTGDTARPPPTHAERHAAQCTRHRGTRDTTPPMAARARPRSHRHATRSLRHCRPPTRHGGWLL